MRFVIIFKLFFGSLASVKTFTISLAGQKDNMNGQTILDICRTTGQKPDTIRKRFDRAYKESGRTYSQAYCPTPEEMEILFPEKRNGKKNMEKSVSEEKIVKLSIQSPVVSNEVPPGKKKSEAKKQPWILYGLMAAPAVASIQNMHSVTGDLTGLYSGIMLTAIFSLAPFAFIVVGLRGWFVKSLTLLMIAYECFCNVMRIYGGLTRFGIDGYPTRFLGLVTDFCNSGTYATARFLSVFMALIAAGVFYAAYLQLNKK
jgi:hypothetical protein